VRLYFATTEMAVVDKPEKTDGDHRHGHGHHHHHH